MDKLSNERRRRIHAEIEMERMRRTKRVRLFDSFMKILVLVIVLHGLGCVTASYVMAWHGVLEPLQSLSETIAREIVAPVVVYGITKTVENISKYNDWIEKIKGEKEESYE
jgi:hypothetical protein